MHLFRVNSSDKTGSTMIELIVMMAMMALWISSMLGVIGSWVDFAKNTEDNIKAINLAREWIEWITNLRDTNWLRFSSDKKNCWKTLNYDGSCIGNNSFSNVILSGSYALYSTNWAWLLSGAQVFSTFDWNTDWSSYKNLYKTWLDTNGYFSQTGSIPTITCSSVRQSNCLTIFTREIQISTPSASDTGNVSVSSIVRWWWKWHHEVRLDTTLTNWKSKF